MRVGIGIVAVVVAVACSSTRREPWAPGATVVVRGRISDTPWAHIGTTVPNKTSAYFDHDGDRQTVVYWTAAPACAGDIELTGVVIEATAQAKHRPSDPSPPGIHRELQLDVTAARCVAGD